MDYHSQLKEFIRKRHGCDAKHVETVPVSVFNWDNGPWEGSVEVFDVTGHEKAKRCYAWGIPDRDDPSKLEMTAVLEMDPVDSPESAVIAALLFSTDLE